MILYNVVYGFDLPKFNVGTAPTMIECHSGCLKGHGIADFIGYTLEP